MFGGAYIRGGLHSGFYGIPEVGNTYHMPHHCVKRKDKSTTRLRVVYDGSSSTS